MKLLLKSVFGKDKQHYVRRFSFTSDETLCVEVRSLNDGSVVQTVRFEDVEICNIISAPFFANNEYKYEAVKGDELGMLIAEVMDSRKAKDLCERTPWAGIKSKNFKHYIVFGSDRAAEIFCSTECNLSSLDVE